MRKLISHYKDISYTYSDKPNYSAVSVRDTLLRVPNDGGTYAFVLHDWQLPEFEYKPRQLVNGYEQKKAMPSTRMLWGRDPEGRIYDFATFSKEWQFWLLDLIKRTLPSEIPYGEKEYFFDVVYGRVRIVKEHPYAHLKCTDGSLLQTYTNLVEDHRSFTDTNAPENGKTDWVTGRNLNANTPYMVKCLMTTGNIVKILGSKNDCYIIEALDLLKSPPPIDSILNKGWLIQWATEQTLVELPPLNGKRRWTVSRYPQLKVACRFNNLPEIGTPFGVFSKGGTNLIKKSHVRIMKPDEVYSPYVPEK